MQRCESSTISIPGPSKGRLEYADYECRQFPLRVQDKCEKENRLFCALWTSAQYFTELGIGFAGMGLVALVIGVSTHSRRRRVWRAVAGLVILHGKSYEAHGFIRRHLDLFRSRVPTGDVYPRHRAVSQRPFPGIRTR